MGYHMNMAKASRAYSSMGANTSIESASPHRLTQLLYIGALDRIARAKGHMQRQEVAEKGEALSKAIAIVEGLRVSLDHSVNNELTHNLNDLYEYIKFRLMEANIQGDEAMLDEASSLLSELKSAWDQIPADLHYASNSDN